MIILQTVECPCSFFSVWVELLPLAIVMYLVSVALTNVFFELLKITTAYRWTVMFLFQWHCAMWVRCWRLPQPTMQSSCVRRVSSSSPSICPLSWKAGRCSRNYSIQVNWHELAQAGLIVVQWSLRNASPRLPSPVYCFVLLCGRYPHSASQFVKWMDWTITWSCSIYPCVTVVQCDTEMKRGYENYCAWFLFLHP